eukprot:TRINITY_DN89502_c0_g1_i1.p1 TRINITY_DN89502_c0_g1~~TRINITY_DN89502_c0_g1_i1.p1  ORF type:complete len:449 (-),score=62.58 TRINITY_DN89502_c0_g1_i1:268-1614(-)
MGDELTWARSRLPFSLSRNSSRPGSRSSVRDPTALRNLVRGVEPCGEVPCQLKFSPLHKTSSVPSGIGECIANAAIFKPPAWENQPRRPASQCGPRQKQRQQSRLTKEQPQQLRYGKDVVPQSLKDLSYWSAVDVFDLADTFKDGSLEKREFYSMLWCVTRDKEKVSRAESDAIFDSLDINGSGHIDRDEFLGWVFATHSAYCGGIRRRMESLGDHEVQEFFVKIDSDGSGKVSKNEFFVFVNHFLKQSGGMSREDSNLLFRQVDEDRSGEIDAQEFLEWIHPVRKLVRLQRAQQLETPPDPSSPPKSSWKSKIKKQEEQNPQPASSSSGNSHLFELSPGKPVILEITAGKQYLPYMRNLLKSLNYRFGSGRIEIRGRSDPICKTVSKLVVKVGRGIVLWDRAKMMAHMEDPFVNQKKAHDWIVKVIVENLPDVLAAQDASNGWIDSK